jgi:hypothetical protein
MELMLRCILLSYINAVVTHLSILVSGAIIVNGNKNRSP